MSADLLKRLIEAGTPAELVAEVAMLAGEVAALERRRASDRERQRTYRNEHNVTSRDNCDTCDIPSPQSPPLKKPPNPKKYTPPLTPHPGDSSAEPTEPVPLTKKEVLEAWNDRMVRAGFPAVRRMTAQRERQLAARLKDSTLEDWQRAMDALERSAFCRGKNDRGWRADFDFLLQPKSFTKLLEGAYDH